MIDHNHPAVEALEREGYDHTGGTMHAWRCEYPDRYPGYCTCPEDTVALVRDSLTPDDLRDTPAGRALMAEGKSLGWDDAIGELRKGQGMHRALAGTLSTRKPNYEETPNE